MLLSYYITIRCCILWCIKVRSNIHPNHKTIRSILLTSGKVASVLISTSWWHMDSHCQLVYVSVTVRTTCYVRNEQRQPNFRNYHISILYRSICTWQYTSDTMATDSTLVLCTCKMHDSLQFGDTFISKFSNSQLHITSYEVVYIAHVQRLAHFYENLQYGALI